MRKVRGEAYKKVLSEAKELLIFAMEVCIEQHIAGRKFVFEHPWLAESWFQRCVQEMLSLEGIERVKLDQCMYDLRDVVTCKRHKKSIGIMTNCKNISRRMHKLYSGDHEHEHIFGSVKIKWEWRRRSEFAQRYPQKMVNVIISGFMEY